MLPSSAPLRAAGLPAVHQAPAPPSASSGVCALTFRHPARMHAASRDDAASPAPSLSAASSASTASDLFLCVDYPGFVRSVPAALDTFKGEANVRRALIKGEGLKLFYRPDDAACHPLGGEVTLGLHLQAQSSSGAASRPAAVADSDVQASGAASRQGVEAGADYFEFLIRVTKKGRGRKRRQEQAQESKEEQSQADTAAASSASAIASPATAPGSITAEVLGMVSSRVSFPGLCDFQLMHPQPPVVELDIPLMTAPLMQQQATEGAAALPAAASSTAGPPPLLLPDASSEPVSRYTMAPLYFTKFDHSRDYSFANHDNMNAAVRSMQAQSAAKKQRAAGAETGEAKGEAAAPAESKGAAAADKKPSKRKPSVKKGTALSLKDAFASIAPLSSSASPPAAVAAEGARPVAHVSAAAAPVAAPSASAASSSSSAAAPTVSDLYASGSDEDEEEADEAEEDADAEGAGEEGEEEEEEEEEGEDAGAEGGKSSHLKPKRMKRRYFTMYTEPTPTAPPDALLSSPAIQSKPLVVRLKELFQLRAVWSADSLLVRLEREGAEAQSKLDAAAQRVARESGGPHGVTLAAPPALPAGVSPSAVAAAPSPPLTRSLLLHHLPALAYRFSGGPWRNLWLRLGFDPRLRQHARQAREGQVADFRVPAKVMAEIQARQAAAGAGAGAGATGAGGGAAAGGGLSAGSLPSLPPDLSPLPFASQLDVHFTRLPSRLHSRFQMCDLEGEEIQQLVREAEVPQTCDDHFGWFAPPALRHVRLLMVSRMNRWCLALGLPPLPLPGSAAHSKRRGVRLGASLLGRAFVAAQMAEDSALLESERRHQRSEKTAATKKRKKEERERAAAAAAAAAGGGGAAPGGGAAGEAQAGAAAAAAATPKKRRKKGEGKTAVADAAAVAMAAAAAAAATRPLVGVAEAPTLPPLTSIPPLLLSAPILPSMPSNLLPPSAPSGV